MNDTTTDEVRPVDDELWQPGDALRSAWDRMSYLQPMIQEKPDGSSLDDDDWVYKAFRGYVDPPTNHEVEMWRACGYDLTVTGPVPEWLLAS